VKTFLHPVIFRLIRQETIAIFIVVVFSLLMTVIDAITISILPSLLNLIQNTNTDELPAILQFWTDLLSFLPPNQQIIWMLFAIALGIVIKNAFYAVSLFVGYGLNARLTQNFRVHVIEALTNRNQQYFDDTNTGVIIENIMNQPLELGFVGRGLIELLINVTSLLVYAVLMFLLSVELAILTVIFGLVAVAVITFYNRWTASFTRKMLTARYALSKMAVETVNGMLTIRAFNKVRTVLEKLTAQSQRERRIWQYHLVGIMMSAPITEVIGTLFIGFIIIWTTTRVPQTGGETLAVLIAFIVVLVRILIPLKEVNRARTSINSHWAVLDRVIETVGTDNVQYDETSGTTRLDTLASQIEFRDVTFSYFNDPDPVLNHINLDIPKGQLTVIIGQSGSGKSTLINLLLNLYQPQAGQILIDNRPLTDYNLDSLRERIAYVQQKAFLFDDTVANNIAFGAKKDHMPTDDDIQKSAKLAVAHDFITSLPHGYDTIIGEQGTSISGGQQQRIAIARAFLRDTDILILDEATSALDQRTEKQLFDQIDSWRKDKTIIMVTHRIDLADLADWLVVLQDGEIVKQGHPDDLHDDDGRYTWLYDTMPTGLS